MCDGDNWQEFNWSDRSPQPVIIIVFIIIIIVISDVFDGTRRIAAVSRSQENWFVKIFWLPPPSREGGFFHLQVEPWGNKYQFE